MEQEINENDASSDSQSISTTRPSSATSTDMPKVHLQSHCESFTNRQSSNIDINDLHQLVTNQMKEQTPIKVLVFNGKCSKIFKSTLEDCVEDCILEFPDEKNSIYVSKSGQATQILSGSNRNSILSLREQNTSGQQSARSNRRRSSNNQYNSLPQISGSRTNLTSNFSLAPTALAVATTSRIRHQIAHQKFSLNEDISEESTEHQTIIEQRPIAVNNESEVRSERHSLLPDEQISLNLNPNVSSLSAFPYHSIPSFKTPMSYSDRQKDYRLSDLVMFGPEYYSNIFNIPRNQTRKSKTAEKLTELDRIKQDLFHRYLWTQNPHVSSRIRSMSTYTRSSTFVI